MVGCCWPASGVAQRAAVDLPAVRVPGALTAVSRQARSVLARHVRRRTSIETGDASRQVALNSQDLFGSPFLYWPGHGAFAAITADEVRALRAFMLAGGLVLFDAVAGDSRAFGRSVRRLLRRALPSTRMQTLLPKHTVYRSFYLLDPPGEPLPRKLRLEAILLQGRAAALYSAHGLGAAWRSSLSASGNALGTPAGAEEMLRLGVNVVVYAVCLDYKDDQVHAPFIMRRRGSGAKRP